MTRLRRKREKCVRRGREKYLALFSRTEEGERIWRYIRYATEHSRISLFLWSHNFCSLIFLSSESPRSGPRRRDFAVSLGTSRFTANLFRGVNHATLIFIQLCSPAQGAVLTCSRNRPEATSSPLLLGFRTSSAISVLSAGKRAFSL